MKADGRQEPQTCSEGAVPTIFRAKIVSVLAPPAGTLPWSPPLLLNPNISFK